MLETTCFSRIIIISGKRHLLAPPSVRQAVEILYVLENISDGKDAKLLAELLTGLDFRPKLKQKIVYKAITHNPRGFQKIISQALTQGYDPAELQERVGQKDDGEKKQSGERKQVDWSYLISEYSSVYHIDPWQVWNRTAFPFFLEMLGQSRKSRARQKIDLSTAVGVGFGGDKDGKILEAWNRQAGGPSKDERTSEKYRQSTPEELKKERTRIRKSLFGGN